MIDDSQRDAWPDWQRWVDRLHYQAWQLNGGCLRGARATTPQQEGDPATAARHRVAPGLRGWRRG
ncbi:hypothetical protein [Modicisalibacter radicis]|uniref:hypothetical protein n=1 Tax=Halomonas sp. EAR18 TaxID=2518972 RepID=UPI00109C09EA|nr:hypothetical protein [Halomonas sp. EAR18]